MLIIEVHGFNIQYPIQYNKQFHLIFTFGMCVWNVFFFAFHYLYIIRFDKIVLDIHVWCFTHQSLARFSSSIQSLITIFSSFCTVLKFIVVLVLIKLSMRIYLECTFRLWDVETFNLQQRLRLLCQKYFRFVFLTIYSSSSSFKVLVFALHRKKKYMNVILITIMKKY